MRMSFLHRLTRRIVLLLVSVIVTPAAFAVSGEHSNARILVIYFSQPEAVQLNGVDAASGASLLQKNAILMGSTEYIAGLIHQQIGGDLLRIETVTPYPSQHDPLLQYALQEQKQDLRPALKTQIANLNDYDTLVIGFPIWWYRMPMVMYSFFAQHDLAGKNLYLFTTHGGSRFADALREIPRLQPNARLHTPGLALSRDDIADSDTPAKVITWLNTVLITR